MRQAHAAADTLISERFRSYLPGRITVEVTAGGGVVRVEVADRSGPGVPQAHAAGGDAEVGRGLGLVAVLAVRWGWRRRGGRPVTWFELSPG